MSQSSRQQGSDPLADFQRWLLRASARGLGRDVRGNLRKTFGPAGAEGGDVWASATSEPPPGEPPECEWCPLCRAARKFKDSGPGIGSHLSSAGDLVATVVQDAVDAFEAVITARAPGAGGTARAPGAGGGAPGAGGGTAAERGQQGAAGERQERPPGGPDDRG